MPTKTFTYDGGWFECDYSGEPTERDSVGCDGLYISEIRIRWNHWKAWWSLVVRMFSTYKWWHPRFWWFAPQILVSFWKHTRAEFGTKGRP